MRNRVLVTFLLTLLWADVGAAQTVVRSAPGAELSQDWDSALQELDRSGSQEWIGYSIEVDSSVQVWMGDFNLRVVNGRVQVAGQESLERLLRSDTAVTPGKSRIALLFGISRTGSIQRARFQDMKLPHQSRREVLHWLGHRDIETSLSHLMDLFQSTTDSTSSRFLVTAIGLHDSPSVLPFLHQLLQPDQPANLRERAAGALAFQTRAEAVDLARQTALADPVRQVREEAVEALEENRHADAEVALIGLLKETAPLDVRLEAAEGLASKPTARAAAALQSLASDQRQDIRLRLEAIEALGEQQLRDSFNRLQDLFEASTERRIRMELIDAIGEQDSDDASQFLRGLLYDSDDVAIQQEAMEKVAEGIDEEAATAFLAQVAERHRDPRIRSEALEELADWLAAKAVQDVARSAVQDPHRQVRRDAVEILGDIGDETAIDALIAIIKDPDDTSLRRFAIEALADSGHPRVRQVLLDLAKGNP